MLKQSELVKGLDSLPDGARAGVLMRWKNGGAHTFVCEKKNGRLFFYDPQINNANVVKYLDKGAPKGFAYYRMDNLDINKNAAWHTVAKGSKR